MNDSATCLPSAALDSNRCRRPDPVPSRVAYHHPLTEYEKLQAEQAAETAQEQQESAPKRRFSLPPAPENGSTMSLASEHQAHGLRIPHPGDLVYWVACLGGGCLLLLCATH
jgi:hypothetical protein